MTYSKNEDVNHRLDLSESSLEHQKEMVDNCRERAYRWILHQFARRGKTAPSDDPLKAGDQILIDVEADISAYFYRRDRAEFSEEEKGYKQLIWKKNAEELLNDYLRSKYPDTYYAVNPGGCD